MIKYILSMLTMASLRYRQRGLTTVEYAIAGGVIAAGVIGLFIAIGGEVDTKIDQINTEMSAP